MSFDFDFSNQTRIDHLQPRERMAAAHCFLPCTCSVPLSLHENPILYVRD